MRDDGTRWSRRDRKRDKRKRSKRLRGNRSVFEIAKAVHKAAREAKAEREKRNAKH